MTATKIDTGRVWVQLISAQALATYMEFRGETVRSLAAKVDVHFSHIGHLRSGHRATCSPKVARAIEKHLQAPPGSLFVAKVSTVSPSNGHAA